MTELNGGNVYDIDLNPAPHPVSNNNARFVNFIGENAVSSIRATAEGNLSVGFRDMRNFINSNFPNLAYVLGHIGERPFHATFAAFTAAAGDDFPDTNVGGNDVDIPYYLGFSLSEIFETTRPFAELDDLNELGIANDPARQAALMEEIRKIYNNLNSYHAYNHSINESDIRKQLKTKTSFGICPHASLKVGYFIKEMNSCLYAKVGFILLKGQVSIISDYLLGKEEKFNKTVPFFALGISKIIDGNWGISAEISHALKTHKKMSDIKWRGYKIENNVGISKTDFRVLATYAF
jgi:hypothetical protein